MGHEKILFARAGWMKFYAGPVPGDDKPIGGGSFNQENVGSEAWNFAIQREDCLYGFVQSRSEEIALQRIDPKVPETSSELNNVLVVFVARNPIGGQVIVGWYDRARVFRKLKKQSPGKPRGHGHFIVAERTNCVLLPIERRTFEIPKKSGMGQANVCYVFENNGRPKNQAWIREAVKFVESYQASNILSDPEAGAEGESAAAIEEALARSQGQGFARNAKERRTIELYAMCMAKRHYKEQGFNKIDDVSSTKPYDLLCRNTTGREIHVEVKGTTTDGRAVILTANEVKHAESHTACALATVHSIRLSEKGGKPRGGTLVVCDPWHINRKNLSPVAFTYRMT
ncbi:MAG TPA: DUF3883 domain-containing protein [Rhizomicrobium sp.]